MIAAVAGFGISGLLVEWIGPRSGFYLDSLSFVVSSLLIFLIVSGARARGRARPIEQRIREVEELLRKTVLQEVRESWIYLLRNRHIRFTAGLIFTLWSALGSLYVILIVFVQKMLHSATKDLGLLIVFLGVGLFIGSVIYGRFGSRISHYKVIFVSLIISGLMLVTFAFTLARYPCFNAAAALSFFLGLSISPIMIASNTIVHRVSHSRMRGKVFSALEIVMHLGFISFMFISSKVAEKVSEMFIISGIGLLFAGIIFFINAKADG
jgi:predicted MFS family arabinose efflux permease